MTEVRDILRKVQCEYSTTCTKKLCPEKIPHRIRRWGISGSCQRKSTCGHIGKVCRCIPVKGRT